MKVTSIREARELLETLRDHLQEQATAAWVVSDFVAEGVFNAKAQEVGYAMAHLTDADMVS
jgi:hypothetical protein